MINSLKAVVRNHFSFHLNNIYTNLLSQISSALCLDTKRKTPFNISTILNTNKQQNFLIQTKNKRYAGNLHLDLSHCSLGLTGDAFATTRRKRRKAGNEQFQTLLEGNKSQAIHQLPYPFISEDWHNKRLDDTRCPTQSHKLLFYLFIVFVCNLSPIGDPRQHIINKSVKQTVLKYHIKIIAHISKLKLRLKPILKHLS